MPPLRTTPLMKPMKTERSHEENQERAYIAASRRSDRSLEARVESARRASEIHKKRTGRSLRVTEQDVLNEEMYEEEDDDLAWQYRRMELMGNLPKMDPDFQRKFQAHVQFQVERSRILAQAVASVNQANQRLSNNQQVTSPTQFMSPDTPQTPQAAFQTGYGQPAPPQMSSRTHSSYRQSPYPPPKGQHHRANSIATPHELSANQQGYSQSTQTSPTETMHPESRRMSLPPQATTPQPYQSHRTSPTLSRINSAADSPVSQRSHRTTGRAPSPTQQTSTHQRHQPSAATNYNDWNISPLTTTLPTETQQILSGGMFPMGSGANMSMQSPFMDQSQIFYNYNPNSKSKHNASIPKASQGMDQTLTSPDGNFDSTSDSNAYNPWLNTSNGMSMPSMKSDGSFDYNLDPSLLYGQDLFNPFGTGSGLATPDEFNTFVDGDMFADYQQTY